MSANNLSAIIRLLNPDNTISAHRMLAHAIGMTETIIYSSLISKQTYYLQNGMLSDDGWFFSTVCDLQESTTFGVKAQKTAISHLVAHGLIECENKGLPAKRHFRVIDNTENLMRLIEEGTEISESISDRSKAKNFVHRQNRTTKKEENYQSEPRENSSSRDVSDKKNSGVPSAVPSTRPAAGTCSHPSAAASSRPAQYKSKDNNPKKNNPKFIKSINQSDKYEIGQPTQKIDRSQNKPMKFSEVLKSLGLDTYNFMSDGLVSEKSFERWDETDRQTQKCQIPYSLKNDRRGMKAALRYLCGYSYYFGDGNDEQRRALWETIICCLSEMVEEDCINVRGKRVMYYEIIDRLNEIISKSTLADCFVEFESEWNRIVAEKKITHHKAYLKSCLWNWLCDYEFENYNIEHMLGW